MDLDTEYAFPDGYLRDQMIAASLKRDNRGCSSLRMVGHVKTTPDIEYRQLSVWVRKRVPGPIRLSEPEDPARGVPGLTSRRSASAHAACRQRQSPSSLYSPAAARNCLRSYHAEHACTEASTPTASVAAILNRLRFWRHLTGHPAARPRRAVKEIRHPCRRASLNEFYLDALFFDK